VKFLLTFCLLLVSTPAIAQQRGKQHASLPRAETREAERRLSDLGYWTGAIDGLFDPATRSALIAFQKWEGRYITGQLTLDELEAIRTSASPKARDLGYAHVEVDLDRQVLMMVKDDGGVHVLPVATGNDKQFVDEGQNSIAYTPRGRFIVYDKEVGWHTGSLGSVYYANYISGGVAIHGSRNVPTQPASHGCIRVPMFAAREVSKLLPVGTIVLVYDKVSFVSAKAWIENPKLKQAALAISAADDETVTEITLRQIRNRLRSKRPAPD
jgi:peptidoglycan hydrolase-like protein with peptidoglycan-binding domain